jgi:hypothetical protein
MTHIYLQSLQSWKTWNDSEESSMLVLSELTTPKARAQPTTHFWLSPAAIFTFDDIAKTGDCVPFIVAILYRVLIMMRTTIVV